MGCAPLVNGIKAGNQQFSRHLETTFRSFAVHLDIITSLFIQLNTQLDCSRMLKRTLKFTLKCSYMFRFNKPSSGSLLLCFDKVIIIKTVS